MGTNDGIKIHRGFIKFILGIFSAIAAISISTLIALNSTPVYRVIINRYNLTSTTGLSKEQLVSNYKILINYLQNPFVKKLRFQNFVMSVNGEIHFEEVKNIFITLMVISCIFLLAIIIYCIIYKNNKINFESYNLIDIFNYSSNVLIGFFVILITTFFIDFSWIFVIFHKIFFRNDYWIFDPETDPVITALPEELFMIYAIIVLAILIITAITVKILYYKKKVKKVEQYA